MLTKIISGGQTGADRGGLEAAKRLGLLTGGTAPKGYRTENGPDLSLKDFGLTQHSSAQYPPRTEENVKNSDGTIIFSIALRSQGSEITAKLCKKHGKPFLAIHDNNNPAAVHAIKVFIVLHQIKILNIAGNRESLWPGIKENVIETLVKALKK